MPRAIVLGLAFALALGARALAEERRPNVLFVAIDDLRPELGCTGAAGAHTPSIDRLASQGVLFERAFCMVPTCGASRASLLTGLRPTPKRFVDYLTWAQADAPGIVTLNAHFKQHGYTTLSVGKVFHHAADSAEGWSETPWVPRGGRFLHRPENQPTSEERDPAWRSPAFEAADAKEEGYTDGRVLARAVADLRRLADRAEPFFLAVGFYRPHLPFVAPEAYWKLHDPAGIRVPPGEPPRGAPAEAIHTWPELRTFRDIPATGPLPEELARTLIQGYRACVSFVDAQVGRLLDELERLELADDTIVVLWGDHGWNLGDHGMWCKASCFESVMRAPLIVRAPGKSAGARTQALTEFIDVYPTLCELAGLPLPAHLDGQSLVPLLVDPRRPGKAAAIGRYRAADTLRTERFRYTEYRDEAGKLHARMLYDLATDPGETVNLAEQPELAPTLEDLQHQLQAGKAKDP